MNDEIVQLCLTNNSAITLPHSVIFPFSINASRLSRFIFSFSKVFYQVRICILSHHLHYANPYQDDSLDRRFSFHHSIVFDARLLLFCNLVDYPGITFKSYMITQTQFSRDIQICQNLFFCMLNLVSPINSPKTFQFSQLLITFVLVFSASHEPQIGLLS